MNTTKAIAIRSDLIRVARQTHGIEGVAPSLSAYVRHGRWSHNKIRGSVGGYREGSGAAPRLSWTEAVPRYGLKPYRDAAIPDDRDVLADLRRVALHVRKPRKMPTAAEYAEHGRHGTSLVQRRFGKWNDAAFLAGLEPNVRPWRGDADRRPAA